MSQFWVPSELIWLVARREWKCWGVTPIVVIFLSGLSIYLSKAVYRMVTRTLQMFDYTSCDFRAVNFVKNLRQQPKRNVFYVSPLSTNLSRLLSRGNKTLKISFYLLFLVPLWMLVAIIKFCILVYVFSHCGSGHKVKQQLQLLDFSFFIFRSIYT